MRSHKAEAHTVTTLWTSCGVTHPPLPPFGRGHPPWKAL